MGSPTKINTYTATDYVPFKQCIEASSLHEIMNQNIVGVFGTHACLSTILGRRAKRVYTRNAAHTYTSAHAHG